MVTVGSGICTNILGVVIVVVCDNEKVPLIVTQ